MADHYDSQAPRFKAWETPPGFFKKLDEEFKFTLDAAASHENALCRFYYDKGGRWEKSPDRPGIIIGAGDGQCRDGITGTWENERVFCKPPYDNTISQWVEKAFKFEAEVAVLLLPPSFDTAWGQKIWEKYQIDLRIQGSYAQMDTWKDFSWSVEIRLPPGRLRFYRPAFAETPEARKPYVYRNDGKYSFKDYENYGDEIFHYSLPHVPGESPRAGNLIAVFRR